MLNRKNCLCDHGHNSRVSDCANLTPISRGALGITVAISIDLENTNTESIYQLDALAKEGHLSTNLRITLPEFQKPLVIFTNGDGRADFDEAHRFIGERFRLAGLGLCQMRVNHAHSQHPAQGLPNSNGCGSRYSFETIGELIIQSVDFLRHQEALGGTKFCLFGSGDGAAAALYAAAAVPAHFSAMILSGGRLASALPYTSKNTVPTLFVLGSEDAIAAETTRTAYRAGRGVKELVEIARASHLLREPGALEDVTSKSLAWIERFVPWS